MTDSVTITLISSATLLIGQVLTIWQSRKNSQKIDTVHQVIDGRMEQLVLAAKAEAKAEGVAQERVESRDRVAAKAEAAKVEKLSSSQAGVFQMDQDLMSPPKPKF